MKLKKLLSVIICISMLLSIVAAAGGEDYDDRVPIATGENLNWLLSDLGTLTIYGSGEMNDFYRYDDNYGYYFYVSPWYKECSVIKNAVIKKGVTNIGEDAFRDCYNLASVVISDSVTSIDDYAFSDCSSLTDVYYAGSEEAWNQISIGSGNDPLLNANVTFNYTGEEVDNNVAGFGMCGDALEWIYYVENQLVISGTGDMTDYNESSWEYYAPWQECSSLLEEVVIGDGATSIGAYAFYDCENLTSVMIGNNVASIEAYAFYNCSSVKDVHYKKSIEEWKKISIVADGNDPILNANIMFNYGSVGENIVGWGACGENLVWELDNDGVLTISGNGDMSDYESYSSTAPWKNKASNIKSAIIENGVTSIGNYAFYDCLNLASVSISNSVARIGTRAFCRRNGCELPLVIPEGVQIIEDYAFDSCYSLTPVTIPASVKSIGKNAFGYYQITVADDSEYFSTDESGTLFNKEKTTLVKYYNKNSETSYTIPDTVTHIGDSAFAEKYLESVIIPDNVVSIGETAFSGCQYLSSLTIGNGVVSIGKGAFSGCSALTSIVIPDSVTDIEMYAFQYCENVSTLIIGEKVNNIGYGAFLYCSSLTSVTIPDSVTKIGESAFANISNLSSITIGEGVKSIGSSAFAGCSITTLTIPDSVTKIGSYAFSSCSKLASVTIGEGVTTIGDCAFRSCRALTSIVIPDNVTSIGKEAFDSCSSLVSVMLGDGVTSIGDRAFGSCSITSIVIPDGVTSISDLMFYYCSNLVSIVIPDSVTTIGEDAFYNCTSLESVTFGDGITTIGDRAFGWCTSLTSVVIPDSVVNIGEYSFYCSEKLSSVIIGDGVTSISDNAFYDCPSLVSVIIGNGVTIIGDNAFDGCSSLASIVIPVSVTEIGSFAFYDCSSDAYVYYGGTEEQWKQISLPEGSNGSLLNANIIYLGDTKIPELTNASIELYSGLTLNFKADASQFEGSDFTAPYVVVTLNGVETIISDYTVEDGKYVFKFKNISANMINDTVTAVLCSTIGEKVFESEPIEYSIATYCYNMLEKYSFDEALRTLLVDMLNYGASSQIYSGYKTNALANAKLTDEQKSWASTTTGELTSVQNTKYETISAPKATWKSAGLNLMDKVEFRIKFISETSDALSVKIKSESGREWTVDAENITDISDELANGYMFYFDGADATMMSETLYFTVYSGDEAISDTFSYSIESYISKKINTEDTAFASLLECIIKYGNAAKNYVNQ